MGDQKEGPYKVVISLTYYPGNPTFSIAVEQKGGALKTLVPDAGEAQTARQLCNFLNKHHREVLQGLATGEGWPEEFGEVPDGDKTEGAAG